VLDISELDELATS